MTISEDRVKRLVEELSDPLAVIAADREKAPGLGLQPSSGCD